jgi:hypothetical protein
MQMKLLVELLFTILLLGCASPASKDREIGTSKQNESPSTQRENLSQSIASRDLLIGKWRHVELVRVVDGTRLVPQRMEGDNFVEFKSDSTWQLVGAYHRSAGTYRWINDEQIEQTILESNLAIQIGLVSIKNVKVEKQRLEFSIRQTAAERAKVLPPPKPGVIRINDTMVITKFDRVIP